MLLRQIPREGRVGGLVCTAEQRAVHASFNWFGLGEQIMQATSRRVFRKKRFEPEKTTLAS